MSKAFTKEDDDTGFAEPDAAASVAIPPGPFRLTATGLRLATPRADPALARAEVLLAVVDPARAALGVTVVVRDEHDAERRYRLVSPEERALVGEGCSVDGPIGRALLGVEVGDVREVTLPGRVPEELEIIALEGEPSRGAGSLSPRREARRGR